MTRVDRNTETGTQTNVTREEEDLKRSPEERWNHPSGEEQSTTGDIQGTGLGKTENDVKEEPTFVQDRRCEDTRRRRFECRHMERWSPTGN